ncbi:unnamed protein product, partial [Musa textilis]
MQRLGSAVCSPSHRRQRGNRSHRPFLHSSRRPSAAPATGKRGSKPSPLFPPSSSVPHPWEKPPAVAAIEEEEQILCLRAAAERGEGGSAHKPSPPWQKSCLAASHMQCRPNPLRAIGLTIEEEEGYRSLP